MLVKGADGRSMIDNHYWQLLKNVFSRARDDKSKPLSTNNSPSLFVSEMEFADGTSIQLQKNSIVVITGPNNSGKSSVLRSISRSLTYARPAADPVVGNVKVQPQGTVKEFENYIEERSLKANRKGYVLVGSREYDLSHVKADYNSGFRGSDASPIFFSSLNASARLSSVEPARRQNWLERSPTQPMQWLDFEISAENEISTLFRKAFGLHLVVNRVAGESVGLHVCRADPPQFQDFKDYLGWLGGLPTLDRQGDGMKSFASALLAIKVHPKGLILLDEPEAFLHDPQARRLAEVITNETSSSTQIWVATHSNEILQGLLDSSNDRIVVIRLDREGDRSAARVLKAEKVRALWADPLLRTSNILSALFHEVAILCEGETDVRFFRAMADALPSERRLPDFKMYHVGGKGKINSIVSALGLLNVPVAVVCDLDILAEPSKFLELFEGLGGDKALIANDLDLITRHVTQRNTLLTGHEAARRLREVAQEVETSQKISTSQRQKISSLLKEASTWARLKADGYRGFENSTVVQAFMRIHERSKAVGLLINREGELEGLCRDAVNDPKSGWLEDVLRRDLQSDASLEDGRKMLSELYECIWAARKGAIR